MHDWTVAKQKPCFADLITISENTYGCYKQYRCATTLYLPSMLSQKCNVIIYCSVGESGHGMEIIDGLNDTDKRFISMLILMVELNRFQMFVLPC